MDLGGENEEELEGGRRARVMWIQYSCMKLSKTKITSMLKK